MVKNLMSILVLAGLVYGAYQINDKYFGGSAPKHSAATADPNMTPFVCPKDVEAFDPAAPDKTMGFFKKGTEIKVGPESGVQGMKNVAYQQPDGQLLQALCRDDDLKADAAPTASATAPLAKNQQTIVAKTPNVSTWLGNGKMTINQGCGGDGPPAGTIRLGQTSGKGISQTFGHDSSAPAPSTMNPDQLMKQRAKDLQKQQAAQTPSSP